MTAPAENEEERLVTTWAERSTLMRKHGDDISADYWADQAQQLSDRIEIRKQRCAEARDHA